jgi:uncharacterized protein YqgC (DUF456 family)
MMFLLALSVLFATYYYVESFKSALPAKRWALAGFVLGPFILPFFTISKRVMLRHAQGFQNCFINA